MFHDKTSEFRDLVRKIKDSEHLEGMKLKSRLTRVREQLLLDYSVGNVSSDRFPHREQVIPWLEDRLAINCCVCRKPFYNVLRRRHHCRTCGSVICKLCSNFKTLQESSDFRVPQLVATRQSGRAERCDTKPRDIGFKIRICLVCAEKLHRFENRQIKKAYNDPCMIDYQCAMQIRRKIDEIWPFFMNLLNELATSRPSLQRTHTSWERANELKTVLTQYSEELETCIRQLGRIFSEQRDLTPQRTMLQTNVKASLTYYLKTKTYYLGLVPKHLPVPSNRISQAASGLDESLKRTRWSKLLQERLKVYMEQLKLLEASYRKAAAEGRQEDAVILVDACQELRTEIRSLQERM